MARSKKHCLMALAALTALAACGAACAQPAGSVTVYGLLDLYAGTTRADGTGAVTKLDSNGYQISRLGFRGTEDLGGGLGMRFVLEHGLSPDTGAASDANRFFNRQSWVGVIGRWGELRAGRQNSPQFLMLQFFDPFGGTYASFASSTMFYVPRYDNMLYYLAPEFGGVKLQGGVSLGERSTAPKSGLNAYIGAAEYRSGPFYVGVNHVRQNSADGQFALKTTFAGAHHDYGSGKAYLAMFDNAPGTNVATNTAGRRYRMWALTLDHRVTPLLTVGVQYGWATDRSGRGDDADGASLMATYSLSKRSILYASAALLGNENGASFGIGPPVPSRNNPTPGNDSSGLQLGLRHVF